MCICMVKLPVQKRNNSYNDRRILHLNSLSFCRLCLSSDCDWSFADAFCFIVCFNICSRILFFRIFSNSSSSDWICFSILDLKTAKPVETSLSHYNILFITLYYANWFFKTYVNTKSTIQKSSSSNLSLSFGIYEDVNAPCRTCAQLLSCSHLCWQCIHRWRHGF